MIHQAIRRDMKQILTFIILGIIAIGCPVRAQVTVESRIDAVQMLIGEQVGLTVTATVGEKDVVEFPHFEPQQMMVNGIEVLSELDSDSAAVAEGMVKHCRRYTITSFDGNLYYLPPLTVKVNGKPMKTSKLALKVIEMEVDTTNAEKFFPPKDVQDNPFLWSDWALPLWLSLLMLLSAIIASYLFWRLKTGKPVIVKLKVVKRLLPHQKAMQAIETIKEDHLTSSENSKEYYTRLTETLRKYIYERYGFNAMEMTSHEIIERLTAAQDAQGVDELRELFTTADLVKFAKYSTLINENDKNLLSAIDFINATKQESMPVKEEKPVLTAEQQKDLKERKTLKWAISLLVGVTILLFVAVAVLFYQNI